MPGELELEGVTHSAKRQKLISQKIAHNPRSPKRKSSVDLTSVERPTKHTRSKKEQEKATEIARIKAILPERARQTLYTC